ncbi:CHASE3 domain-containing protein [Pseudoroseomonas cervicalis]|uniref:CHASE3 domain-containing protein n=1 Tax=Teichococcus cervicalis TaxID=204525 RepID=UPI0027D8BF4B|nr:CHASE3 domain-containing protein [Pseudoroseomonas cervicalis]
MTGRGLRRLWPVLAVALALPVMAAGGWLAWRIAEELQEQRQAVLHSFRLGEATRGLLSTVQDAESGQRGFILTERPAYLAPYEAAQSALPRHVARLRGLVEGPAQQARFERLERLVADKMAELADSLALTRNQGFAAGRALVQTDRGRELMLAIRALAEDMLAEQEEMLRQQVEANDRSEQRNLLWALGALGVALLLLALAAALLLRGNARLRRAQAALAANDAVLQATLDNTQDGVAAFDAGGVLVASNHRFFELLDFPQALARNGTPYGAFLAIDRRRESPLLDAPDTLRGPAGTGTQLSLSHAGRELELYRNPMPDGGFVLSCHDITRRAEAEATLRQAQKMEAVGQLTGGVAHDFNNLLQVVTANLDLLGRELGPDHAGRRYLGHAVSGVARGARLTAQLLAFARRQPLDPRVVNPGRLVQDMAELLRRTLGERIAVEAVISAGQWNTLVDPGQLENVLLNLALNARDAMPEGGRLTIEVGNAVLDDSYATTHLEVEPGEYVLIAVTDTGTGMSPEVMARAFEPFFTTKEAERGTGLGLSQVYGFVKQSGGHVKLYSEDGQGTSVKLYLPRSRRTEEATGQAAGPVTGGRETVLVVEDDEAVREAVVEMLQELGYRVLRAGHAEAALTVVSSGVKVDLLFTDVVMPGPIPTREMVRRAQAKLPGMKVLYTSGYTANAIIHGGRLDPDVQLLSKPYRRDDLARQVRAALGPTRGLPARRGDNAAPEAGPAMQDGAALPGRAATVTEKEGGAARDATMPPEAGRQRVQEQQAQAAVGGGQQAGGPGAGAGAGQGMLGWPEGAAALVVEDDPLIRMNLAQMVEMMGLTPAEAGKADTALAWLDRNPAPAVLITDLSLPGMDGVALAVEARRRCPGLPVLLATGHAEGTMEIPEELRPDLGFLAKPFAMHQLETALRALWEKTAGRAAG